MKITKAYGKRHDSGNCYWVHKTNRQKQTIKVAIIEYILPKDTTTPSREPSLVCLCTP